MLSDDSIDTTTNFKIKKSQDDIVKAATFSFVRKKTIDLIHSSWFKDLCFSIKFHDFQCGPSRSKIENLKTKRAIVDTLNIIYNTNLRCATAYVEQIEALVCTLEQQAGTILNDTIKCSLQQFSIDIKLHVQSDLLKSKVSNLSLNQHSVNNVFVEFLTENCIQIDIPQFSKLYQISKIDYHDTIKPMLQTETPSSQTEYEEEQYVYSLTQEKIENLLSILSKIHLVSIEPEPPEEACNNAQDSQKMLTCIKPQLYHLNLRSMPMYDIAQINSFCSRVSEAIQWLKTPEDTWLPATEWNYRIGVLKKNLSKLQSTLTELIRQKPTDQQEKDEKIKALNRQLQTQIFGNWHDIATDYGLKKSETDYIVMFNLAKEWEQGWVDDYLTSQEQILQMTARCERAEKRVESLTDKLTQIEEMKGRFKEKSAQVDQLNAQIKQAQESAADVKAESRLFVRTISSILSNPKLSNEEIVKSLKEFVGQQAPEFSQKRVQSNDHRSKKNHIAHEQKATSSMSEGEDCTQLRQGVSSTPSAPDFLPTYKATPSSHHTKKGASKACQPIN